MSLDYLLTNFTHFPVQTPEANEFLDMVAGIQGSRMNDQRANLPQFPGLNSQAVINQFLRNRMDTDVPDDSFFEMLMRCQVNLNYFNMAMLQSLTIEL